jgi:hypothetical protein
MINELWLEHYDKIGLAERAQLTRCINGLLAHTFLLSEVYDETNDLMKSSSDYRLVDRHFDWLHDYLAIAGWELAKDRALGVIYVESSFDYNRLQLSSLATLILLTLRLLYDEEREKLALRTTIPLTCGQVVERLLSFNTLSRKPADKDLADAFRVLQRHRLVHKLAGNWQEAACQFLVLPTILLVLTGDAIGRVSQSLLTPDGNQPGAAGADQEAAPVDAELDETEPDAGPEEDPLP